MTSFASVENSDLHRPKICRKGQRFRCMHLSNLISFFQLFHCTVASILNSYSEVFVVLYKKAGYCSSIFYDVLGHFSDQKLLKTLSGFLKTVPTNCKTHIVFFLLNSKWFGAILWCLTLLSARSSWVIKMFSYSVIVYGHCHQKQIKKVKCHRVR